MLGGFFLVDLCNSAAVFLSSLTSASAEKIDKETLVSLIVRGSTTCTGSGGSGVVTRWGVSPPPMFERRDEKKPPLEAGLEGFTTGGLGFSVPDEYTQRMTSAFICSAEETSIKLDTAGRRTYE